MPPSQVQSEWGVKRGIRYQWRIIYAMDVLGVSKGSESLIWVGKIQPTEDARFLKKKAVNRRNS